MNNKAIGVIPASIPIDQSGNILRPEWYLFFQQLYARAGGAIAQNNNELMLGQLDDAGIEDVKADIYSLRDQTAAMLVALQQIIEEINNAPVAQPGYDYNPAAVQITGGAIDGTSIGATTASTGKFTTLTNGSAAALVSSSVALTNGAGASAGTITNAPSIGNPTKWIPINDNGVTRYIPSW